MIETLPIGTSHSFDFLLYRDGKYELMAGEGSKAQLLKGVSTDWKGYLLYKDIAFNEVGNVCTIYDKNKYESKKRHLPVYIEEDGMYKYAGRYKVKKIPTEESIEAANKIFDEFFQYISEIDDMEKLKKLFAGRTIIFMPKPTQIPVEKYNLMEKYRIFRYEVNKYGYILVDCKKLSKIVKKVKRKQGGPITLILKVPSSYDVGRIVGKKGRNIKPLARLIGVEKIDVLHMEDICK